MGAPSDTLAKVQHLYDEQFDYPNASFDSLSVLYNQQYKDFFRQLTATLILTLIIVSLTLFGVFGLAKFASERKHQRNCDSKNSWCESWKHS